jgi:hypothetical protein
MLHACSELFGDQGQVGTAVYRRMIEATHTPWAPWHIVPADNKRSARLNLIRHLLDSIPCKKVHCRRSPRISRGPRTLSKVYAQASRFPTTTEVEVCWGCLA